MLRRVHQHPLWLLPSVFWGWGIWRLSARPASAYRRVGPVEAQRLPVAQIAVLAHLVAFGMLGALLVLGLPIRGRFARAAVACAVSLGYGVIDERHQASVAGRDASVLDVATDGCGAVVGVLSVWAIQRWNAREYIAHVCDNA